MEMQWVICWFYWPDFSVWGSRLTYLMEFTLVSSLVFWCYKYTFKSHEHGRGFHFKDSWVTAKKISLRFNSAVFLVDLQSLKCCWYLLFSKTKLLKWDCVKQSHKNIFSYNGVTSGDGSMKKWIIKQHSTKPKKIVKCNFHLLRQERTSRIFLFSIISFRFAGPWSCKEEK